MEAGLDELKQRQRTSWATGNFDVVARKNIWEMGPRLVELIGVQSGMRVLDVGCGTGNVAVRAAKAGADVTGLDLTPELFDDARRHAADEGIEVEWVEGDAEALPFDDGSFDCVFSSFGVMFAPRHEVAAGEMARVLAPGGVIAVASWSTDGMNGEMFKIVGKHTPPPPPFAKPPFLWGDEDHVRGLFEPHGLQVEFVSGEVHFSDESVEAAIEFMETNFGPWIVAKAALGDDWPALRADFADLYERWNTATDGRSETSGSYLIAIARKPNG